MAAGGSLRDRIRGTEREVKDLMTRLKRDRERRASPDLAGAGVSGASEFGMRQMRKLEGHFGKVYAMHWAGNNRDVVSASQDGNLIVWNALTESKTHAVSLANAWVMTCAFDQTETPRFVAAGGLDNKCSIYDVSDHQAVINVAAAELTGHDGYLSCCRFIGQDQILTSSGDGTCALWNIENHEIVSRFRDHRGDVMSVALHPSNPNVFISGSVDTEVMMWDIRTGKRTATFSGHTSDINAVCFAFSGNTFATGSDDFTCRLFDVRCSSQLAQFDGEGSDGQLAINGGVTSVALSHSGKYLFAGYEDKRAIAWETTSAERNYHIMEHHNDPTENNRISCVGVSPDGNALCTGSWDSTLVVWA